MSKKLVIDYCNDCPFHDPKPNHNSDDTYFTHCKNPDAPENEFRETKIRNKVSIPGFCPLQNDEPEY